MGLSATIEHERFGPMDDLAATFGFVPNLFRPQAELHSILNAEARVIAVILRDRGLTTSQKRNLVSLVARAHGNEYCAALFSEEAPGEIQAELTAFCLKLATYGAWISGSDIEALRRAGMDDGTIIEAITTVGLGQLCCTLARAFMPELDKDAAKPAKGGSSETIRPPDWTPSSGPHFRSEVVSDLPSYAVLREQFGFVPGVYRSQSMFPELVEAEVSLLESVLLREDALDRVQKEKILVAVSAANLNTYCFTLHSRALELFGVSLEESAGLIDEGAGGNARNSGTVLLAETRGLASLSWPSGQSFQADHLGENAYSRSQIAEAVTAAALANFLNTLQFGMGTIPDFSPHRVFTPKDLYRSPDPVRPTFDATTPDDPDTSVVLRVRRGETEAFEDLVRRHTKRVFGTLNGVLGDIDEARDATQDVFLKAFENIERFEGRSKFSTWVTSIAVNTGLDLLRQRKPTDAIEEEENFRPRQVQSWSEDPERLFAAAQMNALVRDAVLRLPQKYRVAVLLRDINQLSSEEAAAVLGLSVPALKARVLRGRLMLRESLAPYFIRSEGFDA